MGKVGLAEVFSIVWVYLDAHCENGDRKQPIELELCQELVLALGQVVDTDSRHHLRVNDSDPQQLGAESTLVSGQLSRDVAEPDTLDHSAEQMDSSSCRDVGPVWQELDASARFD